MLKAAYLQSEDWSFAAFLHKKWNVEMLKKIDDFSATDDVSKFLILSCIADNPEDIQFWATKDGIEQRFNSHDLSYLDNLNALKSEYDYKKLKNLEFRLILKNKLAEYAFGDFKIEREKEFIKKYSYLGKDNWLFSHQVSTYEVASILKGSILKGFIMHKSNKVEIKVEIKYENAQAVQNEP